MGNSAGNQLVFQGIRDLRLTYDIGKKTWSVFSVKNTIQGNALLSDEPLKKQDRTVKTAHTPGDTCEQTDCIAQRNTLNAARFPA